jgi:hypothetical protein
VDRDAPEQHRLPDAELDIRGPAQHPVERPERDARALLRDRLADGGDGRRGAGKALDQAAVLARATGADGHAAVGGRQDHRLAVEPWQVQRVVLPDGAFGQDTGAFGQDRLAESVELLRRRGRGGDQRAPRAARNGAITIPPSPPTNRIRSVIRLTELCVSRIASPGARTKGDPPGMISTKVPPSSPSDEIAMAESSGSSKLPATLNVVSARKRLGVEFHPRHGAHAHTGKPDLGAHADPLGRPEGGRQLIRIRAARHAAGRRRGIGEKADAGGTTAAPTKISVMVSSRSAMAARPSRGLPLLGAPRLVVAPLLGLRPADGAGRRIGPRRARSGSADAAFPRACAPWAPRSAVRPRCGAASHASRG